MNQDKIDVGATDCGEFMGRHSEYLDGLLPTLAAARLRAHVEACAVCARYDRVVRKGIDLVRDLPPIEPDRDFEQRLQHRLYHLEDANLSDRPAAGAAATLVVAAFIAMLAWSPLLVTQRAQNAVAGGAAVAGAATAAGDLIAGSGGARALEADSRTLSVGVLSAFMEVGDWYPLPTSAPHAATLAAFPGPYSPLVVTPPLHRAVRTVSTRYTPVD